MCVSFRINFYILLIIFKAFNGCALTSYVPGRSLSSPLVTKGDRGNTVPPHDMLQSVFMLPSFCCFHCCFGFNLLVVVFLFVCKGNEWRGGRAIARKPE